jgi:REP element-mobilizing transposase RayT
MAQSLSKVIVHLVFSTKERRPFLGDKAVRDALHRYLGSVLTNLDCQPISVGGVEDHVHLLFALSRTATSAEVVKELKRTSSIWLKGQSPDLGGFAWQGGYGAFSLGISQVDAAKAYIDRQEAHHCKVSFQNELRTLLKRYKIPFDERYVWD